MPSSPARSLSTAQIIVELLLAQKKLDEDRGWETGGFVTGYRGSPLGGLDFALWAASQRLEAHGIIFKAGLNEDLAATAVWGTQQLDLEDDKTVEGVFGLWYGKGPGVDRSGDAFKHGNYAGAMPRGGVLLLVGDDHPGKSSSIAHQSEQALAASSIPILNPSNMQDVFELGLHGWAMSRYSGLWAALKLVNETAEITGTVDLPPAPGDILPELPEADFKPSKAFVPAADEIDVIRRRIDLAIEYARKARLNYRSMGAPMARLGLISTGKAYADTLEALTMLGLSDEVMHRLGISLFKVRQSWPLEPQSLRDFTRGCEEIFFIEEKRAFIEDQAARLLYNETERPSISGKYSPDGQTPLLQSDVILDPLKIAHAILGRMAALGLPNPPGANRVGSHARQTPETSQTRRLPYFCSGCPHSTSTVLPKGSEAFSGIGCHGMAQWMPRHTRKGTHMGAEGANWMGLSHFTRRKHIFQNMGDGTYAHSGLLAIRAAVHSGVNITYKILVNDAVAMTGGQPIEGSIGTEQIVQQVLAEGVARCIVVGDQDAVKRLHAKGIDIKPREELNDVQKLLSETPGTTVLIYEQTCATEARRRRKRSGQASARARIIINPDICEGCGDCSVQSNCVSIVPLETEFGTKRAIDQSNCNQDYSCLKGLCPSFVTFTPGPQVRRGLDPALTSQFAAIPDVDIGELPASYDVILAGIGGTGIVTVAETIAAAARIAGLHVSSFNMTGLAQKNGAVFSHVRLAASHAPMAARVPDGNADLLLACDMVAATAAESLQALGNCRSIVVADDTPRPTSEFIFNRDHRIDGQQQEKLLRQFANRFELGAATQIAEAILGDTLCTNMVLLGYAWQKRALPLPLACMVDAIALGKASEQNKNAFQLGRMFAHEPASLPLVSANKPPATLGELIESRERHLKAYQNAQWADRYRKLVDRVSISEAQVIGEAGPLTKAVAENLARVMSYKDEYEVARLYAEKSWTEAMGYLPANIRVHLAPPLLARRDPATGRPAKIAFGKWIFPVFRLLSAMKLLRNTPLDIFGYTQERKRERQLIQDYEHSIEMLLAKLNPENHAHCTEIAQIPSSIRGYGVVKERAMIQARERWDKLKAALQN